MGAAIVLFAIGPMWWDVQLWGIWWWVWVLGAVAIALFWLLWSRLWPPVLDRPSVETGDLRLEHLRHRAKQWYTDRPARAPTPTPAHVLIAAGPGGAPSANMATAVRFAALPSAIAGAGLLITKWVTYPLLSVDQQDSVVLGLIDTVAWEVVEWLLAAAALGLAWQHLPGRRGLVKALPLVLTYATTPVILFWATRASDGVPDWVPLADVALFALVMVFVALRLDFAALDGVHEASPRSGRLHRLLDAFGLGDLPRWSFGLITFVALVLPIWTALTGGEASFPSIDPAQLSRR
ncbi:hypothetical protein ALI22I_11400 [Saccharothrix sp. ALI-22-I]|uniref:DUF6185 family protein n=1 Tax=Saccharothrix sp. ALI-22-I TaxID=1933778 RepID=UPI00097C98CA|nr:DUF6185 family protein [Saccharothrix sp. ALI-22-I]ONI90708.1 hypothetical protein ALI22I_11400 [Saccharothrix sp. ALI-22-I]